ncbi:unnamed protein product [Rotaria sordida]|uniref:Protein THEM6 n=1 Tax=Rotaria sordida TaxID=392033 RepID=A0A814WML0_9BILA|nr:unnamed protein product [Rotaria sordida]CAF3918793.1 unnamed protein product [Rotaria sordida]
MFDIGYAIRVIALLFRYKGNKKCKNIFSESVVKGRCWPNDLDLNWHMNNSRYLRECDFGRYSFLLETGLWNRLIERRKKGMKNSSIIVSALQVQYRQSVELGDRFEIRTRINGWDDKAFYFEQSIILEKNQQAAFSLIVRLVTIPRSLTPQMLIDDLQIGSIQSPKFSPAVVCKYPQQGYYLHGINIKKPFIYDLSLSYGKDFIIIHHQILKQLNKIEWKGIILLYGIPGTGKTYYIRYLINELQEKNLIYFPSDIIRVLSSSEILQILKPYSHSIIIIDDAENLNKDHPDQVLNNLFNLNHLSHRPIIATFNSYLPQIFSHHKTSSIIQYSFNKLDIINSRILLKTLGSQRDNETIKQSMTLGEIYAQITFETKIQNENIIESRKKLKTPDEMIQLLAEQELSLSDKDNCTLS